MKITYNIDVQDESDEYVRLSEVALAAAATALVPGKFVVEVIPFLRHMPAWFPGSGKQKVFTECQAMFRTLEDTAYEHVKSTIVSTNNSTVTLVACQLMIPTFSSGDARGVTFDSRSDDLGLCEFGQVGTS